MARIEPAEWAAAMSTADVGQGDRINLGVAGIMGRLPDVAAAVGGVTAALHCALCVGLGRLAATWNVTEDLPSGLAVADGSPVAPWRADSVVASG